MKNNFKALLNVIFNRTKFKIYSLIRYDPEDERAVSRKYIALSSYAAETTNNLIGGTFLTGFLLLMNADDAFMGWVTMAGFFGNLLQLLSPLLLERYERRKKLLLISRATIYFFNIIIIGSIPFFVFSNNVKLTIVISIILLLNIINALFAPGFSVWHIKSIPQRIRAQYFSFYRITSGIIIYTVILISSAIVDSYKVRGNELKGLIILRIIAIITASLDIYLQTKIKEYPNEKNTLKVNLLNVFVAPFKEKKYLITVIIACLWSFSANIPGPYYTIYLLKDLNVKYSFLNFVNMLNIPVLIFFTPIWSRIIQKTSWFKALYISMGLYTVYYISLCFVTGRTLMLYPFAVVYAFIIAAGINLTFSNIPYINIPSGNQTNYIGFYSTMNNLAALLGVTLGKEFIKITENKFIKIFNIEMQNKQYILILTALVMLFCTSIIYVLQKKVNSSCECSDESD
ncbi:MAG TPA: MFS transporter [Clostridiaceae bacterium]|nr:MFS transporter [Clostridiaceae bacterium]